MRQMTLFSLLTIAAVALTGCKKPEDQMAMDSQSADMAPSTEPDTFYTDSGTGMTTDPGPAYPTYETGMSTVPPVEVYAAPAPSGRIHQVQKGDTLYSLARKYYNNQARWKDIYQANGDQLTDPNKLRVGQSLIIP